MQKNPLDYYEYEESFWESSGLKRFCERTGISAFFEKYWKIIVSVMPLFILAIYFIVYIQKGISFEGEFYRTEKTAEGIQFEGIMNYDSFQIHIKRPDGETCNVTYTRNGVEKEYRLEYLNQKDVIIYEDEELYFEGTAEPVDYMDAYVLRDKEGEFASDWFFGIGSAPESLSASQIFSIYMSREVSRGSCGRPEFIFLALITFGIWLIDIWFPRFFFMLNHVASVKDPEPTEWYEFTQKISWVIIPIIAVVLLTMSLF